MLNFELFLYKEIGFKIKEYRKGDLKLTQDEFSAKLQTEKHISIDKFRLSAIENGKSHKDKNPYLLTDQQIEIFASMMGCDIIEFIFGDYDEREENIKLFLLALIMNSVKGKGGNYIVPFIDGLFRYRNKKDIKKLINNEVSEITGKVNEVFTAIKETKNKLEEIYPFFANENLCERYQHILHKQSSEIELISNLLIKLMFGFRNFTNYYIIRVHELCEEDRSNEVAYNFLENKGIIAGRLIDGKNGIYIFASAFEKMWKRHKEAFKEYFDEHLFNKVKKSTFKFKQLNNDSFNCVATSDHFSSLLFSLLEKDRFSIETSAGHYLFYQHMLNRYEDKEVEDSYEF